MSEADTATRQRDDAARRDGRPESGAVEAALMPEEAPAVLGAMESRWREHDRRSTEP